MTLVCFGSVKGSPGVTLTSLLTAAVWPVREGRQKLLLEADPAGGSLAVRYQMPTRPGLLSLAAATGNSLSRDGIWEHAQALPGGLPAVVAPPSPDQASVAMRSVGADMGDWLSAAPIDVIADIGRISPSAPTARFMSSADAVLVVARPTADQLQPAAHRMSTLSDQMHVGWVLVGDEPYSPHDVVEAFGFPVVSVLPDDERAATRVVGGADPAKLKRSPLIKEVGRFAESLTVWLAARADRHQARDAARPPVPPQSAFSESPSPDALAPPPPAPIAPGKES